jgi:hypothetical protein
LLVCSIIRNMCAGGFLRMRGEGEINIKVGWFRGVYTTFVEEVFDFDFVLLVCRKTAWKASSNKKITNLSDKFRIPVIKTRNTYDISKASYSYNRQRGKSNKENSRAFFLSCTSEILYLISMQIIQSLR